MKIFLKNELFETNDAFILESINKPIGICNGISQRLAEGGDVSSLKAIGIIVSGVVYSTTTIDKQHHSDLRKLCAFVNIVVKAYSLA